MARTNSILFIIIIFLALIAWFQPGLHEAEAIYLTSLKANKIETIIIERQDLGTVKLKKYNNGWYLEEPYQLPANPLRVNTITALAEKHSFLQFQVKGSEFDRYHLKKPPISVWLNEDKITLGSEDPINQQRYAMNISDNIQSGNNTIHLINGVIYYQLRANLDTFISPALLPPQVNIKSIAWAGKKLTISGTHWELKPDSPEVTSDSMTQFIQSWQRAQASRVETNVSLPISSAELQKSPSITITFTSSQGTADPAAQSITFLVIKDGRQIKLLRPDIQVSYWISPSILKQLTEFLPEQHSAKASTTR